MTDWIEIGRVEDVPRQGARLIATPSGNVAIFRTVDDEIFAVRDLCPHKGGPLSQGIVCGKRVACPLHNWVIDLASGEAAAPDEGRTACFPVKVENERLWLQLVRLE